PVKEGFEFVAWQLEGIDFNFDTVIEEDIILVAKWEEVIAPSTIKFTSNFSAAGNASKVSAEHFDVDGSEYFTLTSNKNSSSTDGPLFYSNGTAVRFYGAPSGGNGNSLVVTAKEGYVIISIVLIFPTTGQTAGSITAKSGTAIFMNKVTANSSMGSEEFVFNYADYVGVNNKEFNIQNTTSDKTQFRLAGMIIEIAPQA
ncbi:MAG TPA: hypothetical protein GXZ79_01530, partial [Acholeplasma sp.]|nr:hypothetical protein [Acholeplasma sp.]